MKRLLAWITILCILLGHVSPISTALAMDDEARDVAMSENETDAANFTKTIVAGDGSTYEIRVTYNGEIGIPAEGTELVVKELLPGDAEYDYYISESAAKLNKTTDELTYSRLFDIKIVDANDPEKVYEPTGDVSVSIRLVGEQLNEYDNVDVLHFTEDEAKKSCEIETVETSVEGENLEFTTDSFSVYVVIAHEDGDDVTVVTPRVMFHFIGRSDGSDSHTASDSTVYYSGTAYEFYNKNGEIQKTQILKNGESLEFITDPANTSEQYFYGWYVVSPYMISGTTDAYGIGTSDDKLYYTWPAMPNSVAFETAVSIEENNVNVNDLIHWSIGSTSGNGLVDKDGNVHVFLAPVYENYSFVNFMLYPYVENGSQSQQSNAGNVMTRKLVAIGSADPVEVKVSDIRSDSTDADHRLFVGWKYNLNGTWHEIQTIDYSGAEIIPAGKDGVYLSISLSDLAGKTSIDLYPVFVEARWLSFVSGKSGSGASYVGSRFLEAWDMLPPGTQEVGNENVFTNLDVSTRKGYTLDGWYAFADYDENTGEILNLSTATSVKVSYVADDGTVKETTVTTTAIRITDGGGNFVYSGEYSLNAENHDVTLFSVIDGKLKFYKGLDKLTLHANWNKSNSSLTIVYWIENANDDDYTSAAVRTIETNDLNSQLGTNFHSGDTITAADLSAYKVIIDENEYYILNTSILGQIGAVPKGYEKFFDLDTSTNYTVPVVINGDGSTLIDVYYSRKVFKLVFHIGRDGYVKNAGNQKTTEGWIPYGNWIQFMYYDNVLNALLTACNNGIVTEGKGYSSYHEGTYSMTFDGKTYDNNYVTNSSNIMGNYVPNPNDENDQNLYVIEAKYGAYIGDRWPSQDNQNFQFTIPNNAKHEFYTWSAFYDSYYCYIANNRHTSGGQQGDNPDINGVYSYMSSELCTNRAGTDVIENQVHHIVAYFGDLNKAGTRKKYHLLYEAVEGTYDISSPIVYGNDYTAYNRTTWSTDVAHVDSSVIVDKSFVEDPTSPRIVISNVNPEFQMGWELDGYDYFYSCYNTPNTNDHHVYFFYTPKSYALTFKYDEVSERKTDYYYYKQSLAEARKYPDPEKEGYTFRGWYTNEAGLGDAFDFANATMPSESIVLYPIFDKLDYVVKIDPNGGVIDRWKGGETAASTGFRADYKETISPYNNLKREFFPTNDSEIASMNLDEDNVYYYMNAQYISEEHDGRFIPSALRNALYLTSEEIDEYWAHYSNDFSAEDFTNRGATKITDKNEWMDYYFGGHVLSTLPKYRAGLGAEHYDFMGWYQVFRDASNNVTLADNPFDFNTQVTENIEIRAMWRLVGGYSVQYEPCFISNDTVIGGDIAAWTDPEASSQQLYSDKASTQVMYAPTGYSSDWVFRGWRLVRSNGTVDVSGVPYTNWEPVQADVYYQPGDRFVIEAQYAEMSGNDAVIHLQAYYEPKSDTYRRPDVTNLILDANDDYFGYIVTEDSSGLSPLPGPGRISINTDQSTYSNNNPTQILLGDFQSNISLHLYRYASTETYNEIAGTNFFTNANGYLLIGFDENADPANPTTGKAYIPAFSTDSVIAVTRDDHALLYAMWEPMVYATFVNTTDEDIEINISGTGASTVSIVNKVTGAFSRESSSTTFIIPAKSGGVDGSIKVVFPAATAGVDSITVTATNTHLRRLMSVAGQYPNSAVYGTGSTDIKCGNLVSYDGTLVTDKDGIIVTYTETVEPQVLYDVNGGTWNPLSEDPPYQHSVGDLYFIEAQDIITYNNGNYEPAEPSRTGKVFIGWTEYDYIAAHTDFSSTTAVMWDGHTITPDTDGIVLDKIRGDYLWDFSQNPELLYNNEKMLYAVWSDAVTVTFNISRDNSNNHIWNGPATSTENEPYCFFRYPNSSPTILFTMAVGEIVPKPENPSADTEWSLSENEYFLTWLKGNNSRRNQNSNPTNDIIKNNTYDFSQRVTENIILYTSWTDRTPQVFTFTVENHVIGSNSDEEFEYTIAVQNEKADKGNKLTTVDNPWGSVTTKLTNNEKYTVRITVRTIYAFNTNDNFGGEIEVIDRNGNVIACSQFIKLSTLQNKYYSSSYRMDLLISQSEKEGYNTSVNIAENSNSVDCFTGSNSFSFSIQQGKHFIGDEVNTYVAGATNNVVIAFTNVGPYVAPTDYRDSKSPFLWLFAAGLVLLAVAIIYGRRKASVVE